MTWAYDGPEQVSGDDLYYITFEGGFLDGETHGRGSLQPYYAFLGTDGQHVYQPEVPSLKKRQTYRYTGSEIPKPPRPTYEPDPKDVALVASLVGRTIVAAEWVDESGGEEWTEHEVGYLTLDDGRTIRFGSYGYDAWGAEITLVDPKERRAV